MSRIKGKNTKPGIARAKIEISLMPAASNIYRNNITP
jgi:hypothetical protein